MERLKGELETFKTADPDKRKEIEEHINNSLNRLETETRAEKGYLETKKEGVEEARQSKR